MNENTQNQDIVNALMHCIEPESAGYLLKNGKEISAICSHCFIN